MVKRSPRYPRHNLGKAVEMTRKLFLGAHQSRIDVDTAARVIGYANSSSGAAASAIGALRQFGLVDGLRGDLNVSDLAMRILQPMNETERTEALREAAEKPEIFGRIIHQFGGRLPASDEPVKSYLIRQEGFSPSGSVELITALRETLDSLPIIQHDQPASPKTELPGEPAGSAPVTATFPQSSGTVATPVEESGLIVLPLSASCRAELRFVGSANAVAYGRLIRHLELLRDMLEEDSELSSD